MLTCALVVLFACSRPPPGGLPQASVVLRNAAQAMAGVTSTTFSLQVSGDASGLPIGAADGSIERGGLAIGSLVIGGSPYPFRLVGGIFYLQNPDHSWVTSPPAYDPSSLLDPTTGLASLLAGARHGRTLAQDSVGAVTADKVQAMVPSGIIQQLSYNGLSQSSLPAILWVSTESSRLVKFRITFRAPGTQGPTVVTVTLKDFNRPLAVQAPRTR
jgi:lipoprotein LprG